LRKFSLAVVAMSSTAWAEPVTIAALGDSLTQGYGLAAEDGFVPQLQSWLTDNGADVVVINAGVSGDTTAGGLARVDWTLTPDVDAMIVALGGNDFLRGLDPAVSRENLRAVLTKARDAGVPVLLVGLEVSTNYGEDYKDAFDAIYPALAEEFGVPLYPTFFEGLVKASTASEARAAYMQADGLHPNPAGVIVIVEDMGPVVLDLIAGLKN
jgi:acyl-CoA thioesterase-1